MSGGHGEDAGSLAATEMASVPGGIFADELGGGEMIQNPGVNERKRLGGDVDQGGEGRRVRIKVAVPFESPEGGGGEIEESELDKRMRVLAEVVAQRKGDSPLARAPGGVFRVSFPTPLGASLHQNFHGAHAANMNGGALAGADSDPPLAVNGFSGGVGDPPQGRGVEGLDTSPGGEHGFSEYRQAPLETLQGGGMAPPQENVPFSQHNGQIEDFSQEEVGGGEMQMEEGGEENMEGDMEDHGFGPAHGFGATPPEEYGEYEHPPPEYGAHEGYEATEDAQQLAEHAGFGGGHMEQDEDPEHLHSLDLVEVGFPRSSVTELQTLPPDDLITRVLDLEERICAVVREKQLEAAARQEAEDQAARYAEESRQLRQVVREKNGYKKGVLHEIAALEGGPPVPPPLAGRFTITRENSPGGGLRLEKGNKGKSKSEVKEKWKAEWKKAASRGGYIPPASLWGGEEYGESQEGGRQPGNVKGFRSRKGPVQATPASKLLAILGAEPDEDENEHENNEEADEEEEEDDEEYVAPARPPPRPITSPPAPRSSRAESTVGLEDLTEFLKTCCKARESGHMTLHRVLWYTYLAWRQKVGSQRPSVSSGGVGLSQCMSKLGHRERLFTREIQAKKAGLKGYEGGGKYWMGLVVLDKALVKTGRQWLAKAKRTGNSNRVTFSRDSAVKVSVRGSKEEPAEEENNEEEAEEA